MIDQNILLAAKLEDLNKKVDLLLKEKTGFNDWIDEETTMRLTGCKRTKLYHMRKEGKIIGVPFDERKMFYRKSKLEAWLLHKESEEKNKPIK